MKKDLVFLTLLNTCLLLAGCASSLPKAENTGMVSSPGVEADNQTTEGSTPEKIEAANEAITWGKSDTETNGLQEKPDLSGSWILNKELSDNSQEKIKESRGQAGNFRDSKSMDDGRGGGRSGKGGGGRQGGGGGRQKNLPQELQALLKASEYLKLKHDEPLLTITTKDGQRQQVYTDFRGASVSASSAMDQKVITAGWESDVLVVETTLNSGSFIQRYHLIATPRQLWVSTIIQTSRPKPVQFNRVYEQAIARANTSKHAITSSGS